MNPLSYYTEKNGLAQFWNRDMTRLEWAKWVYHHPEQTQELIDRLLNSEENDLTDIKEAINELKAADYQQQRQISNLQNRPIAVISDEDIDNITGVDLNG